MFKSGRHCHSEIHIFIRNFLVQLVVDHTLRNTISLRVPFCEQAYPLLGVKEGTNLLTSRHQQGNLGKRREGEIKLIPSLSTASGQIFQFTLLPRRKKLRTGTL